MRLIMVIVIMFALLAVGINAAADKTTFCEGLELDLNVTADFQACETFWSMLNQSNTIIINNTKIINTSSNTTIINEYKITNVTEKAEFNNQTIWAGIKGLVVDQIQTVLREEEEKSEIEQLRSELEALKKAQTDGKSTTTTTANESAPAGLVTQEDLRAALAAAKDAGPSAQPDIITSSQSYQFLGIPIGWLVVIAVALLGVAWKFGVITFNKTEPPQSNPVDLDAIAAHQQDIEQAKPRPKSGPEKTHYSKKKPDEASKE